MPGGRTIDAELLKKIPAFKERLLHEAMRQQNLSYDDIGAAIRSQDKASVEDVGAVVIEINISFGVIASLKGDLVKSVGDDVRNLPDQGPHK